jgi:dolichol-phosphate mannosyltransferase
MPLSTSMPDAVMESIQQAAPPDVSIVIAVLNEAENVRTVCEELLSAVRELGKVEIVFVDDGSTDTTGDAIVQLRAAHPEIRLLRHDRRCGKTAALRTGIAASGSAWVATMDGDGQNDPADIRRMVQAAWDTSGPAPLVAGVRGRRHDPPSRLIATRIANGLRQRLLGDHCPDSGCGMKVFRRDDFLRLPAFEGMHRFLPALFQAYGRPLVCCEVSHRPRLAGRSKYTNFGRAIVGIRDTLGVMWLRNRTRLPSRVEES